MLQSLFLDQVRFFEEQFEPRSGNRLSTVILVDLVLLELDEEEPLDLVLQVLQKRKVFRDLVNQNPESAVEKITISLPILSTRDKVINLDLAEVEEMSI